MSILSPDGETRRGELRPGPARFVSLNLRTAEPAGVCGVCLRSRKNRSYRGQILFQIGERVSIPGRGCVLRNFESARDFSKSEAVPDFHHQHLPLLVRQKIERSHKRALRFVLNLEHWLDSLIGFGSGSEFAASASAVAPEKIKRNGSHRRVEEATVRDVVLFPPKTNESFLDNVFGVGRRSRPLPRE